MTRKEEIKKASVEYQLENKPMAIGGDAFADMIYKVNVNPSFVAGAEWADNNPIHYDGQAMLYVLHKGVEQGKKEMLDKACNWLSLNLQMLLNVFDVEYNTNDTKTKDFIDDFKKAMEDVK